MTRATSRPLVHLELHTGEPREALRFYAEVLGWRAERILAAGGSYLALETGGAVGGGIVECAIARPAWLPYVEVADVTAVTEEARRLGAAVLLEPRDGPAGRRSVVATAAGGEIALWQPRSASTYP
jgi:predicted enzyme related to lactoylglutathione lyase